MSRRGYPHQLPRLKQLRLQIKQSAPQSGRERVRWRIDDLQGVKIHFRVLAPKVDVTMGRHVIHIVDLYLGTGHGLLPDRHYDIYIILTDQT